MNSNQYEGIVIAIAAIVFSLLILAIFFYRIYLMINGNGDQSADEVENEAIELNEIKSGSNLNKLQRRQGSRRQRERLRT